MKDKNGHEFVELTAIQDEHLTLWGQRLRPEFAAEIRGYVKWANRESGADGKHRVFRGQDLIEIIRTWPVLGDTYPTKEKEVEGL